MSRIPVRYLGWMARDFARGPGLLILVAGALAVFAEQTIEININNDTAVLGVHKIGSVFVLLATAGIVSRDMTDGYYRTIFARPVSPPLYYLQRWLLGGIAVVLAVFLLDAGVAIRLHVPMIGSNLIARAGLTYLLLGGLIFLLSTVTRRDWLVAVLLMLVHGGLGAARSSGFWQGHWAGAVYNALPPFQLVGFGEPVAWGRDSAHAAGYGLALFAAAIVMLRWRPLGSGMRD